MRYKPSQYAKTLYEMTKGKEKSEIPGVVSLLTSFLKKNNDLHLLKKISDEFELLYNKKEGIVGVWVTSKEDIANKESVANFIKKEFIGKQIDLKYKKNDKIKGGIIIQTKDHIIDASLGAKITKLKKYLF